MILSTNGQNIYPEEIEVVLNQLPYVAESLIVSRENRLIVFEFPEISGKREFYIITRKHGGTSKSTREFLEFLKGFY